MNEEFILVLPLFTHLTHLFAIHLGNIFVKATYRFLFLDDWFLQKICRSGSHLSMHDYWGKCLGQRLSSPGELGGIPRMHFHRVKGSLVIILLRTSIYGFLNIGCRWLESKFGLLLFTRV